MMRLASEVSVRYQPDADENVIPTSEVLLQGIASGTLISGAVLEAAVQWRSFYLLFLTDDVPFEEGLNIHLLDERGALLDSATLGGAYSSGHFHDLLLGDGDTLSFRFIGDTTWHLELLQHPQFRLPLVSEPAGVSRRLGFSRHFILRGNPKPQVS
ncbi:hypothetical protein HKK55_00790 [Pseudomonas sp. ADAK18]|nr:hypothetical protein HKK55_00790 [Pseudomonas sp. ADAK18]